MKKIIFCTLRDNKGATGGPGGVLFLQKEILGDSLNGTKLKYQFNFVNGDRKIYKLINTFCFLFKYFFSRDFYFIVHDVRTAVLLAMMRKKYSLIFHHQGPLVEELLNLGVQLSEKEIQQKKRNEKKAFICAKSLHFPSIGASEIYFKSKYASCMKSEVNLSTPLYNVIPSIVVTNQKNIGVERYVDTLTFFSVGTLTIAKGQDKTVDFIESFLKVYKNPVRYILVGKGPLKDQLLNKLEYLREENNKFSYFYYEALPHESVMYLHQISDIYIMLHRISIFDFATLEAMALSSAVVLSKIGGNIEVNLENNILFADDVMQDMTTFAKTDFSYYKSKNRAVYEKYFSENAFKFQYEKLINIIKKNENT